MCAYQLDDANTSEFSFFQNKTSVIQEEIHAFLEIHAAFNSLENLVNGNLLSQKELRKEIDEVSASSKLSFGLLKKQSKDERLNDLREKLKKCDYDCDVSSELFSIVAAFVLSVEIPNFKKNHHTKWNFILKTFSEERAKRLRNEEKFWDKLKGFTSFE